MVEKLRVMSDALNDTDLRRLALDEEEADAPIDYDITIDDLKDVMDELLGRAGAPPEEEE
jgi:hypothetical protein